MRTRVFFLLLILISLVGTGLNLLLVKQRISYLKSELQRQTDGRQESDAKATLAGAELAKTTVLLKQTGASLQDAKTENEQVKGALANEPEQAPKLSVEFANATSDRDKAQVTVGLYAQSRLTPEQAVQASERIAGLERELTQLRKADSVLSIQVASLKRQLSSLDSETPVPLPAALKGKVLLVDPK